MVFVLLTKMIKWDQCSFHPIIHGAYNSTYFGDQTINDFGVWSVASALISRFDILSNGDIVVGYKSNIQ